MKAKIATWLCCMVFSISVFAGTETPTQTKSEMKTETFSVYGNCTMCKTRIEGALKKKDGVLSKNWDKEKKVITVTYDPAKITVQQIGEKIAAVGHDNQYATATDKVYDSLHQCCQYERPKQSK